MSTKRRSSLLEQIKGRWREFRREPSAVFFVILMPILWMTILGFAFSRGGAQIYGVGWPSESDGAPGELHAVVRAALEQSAQVRVTVGTPDELETAIKRGDVQVVVMVAEGTARYIFDPVNRESAGARAVVNELVQRAAGRTDPVPTTDEQRQIVGTRYVDFLVPGLLALSIMTSSLFGTGMTIVSNRRENLLKRYLATPMRPFEYIISHIVGRGFVLSVELVSILLAAFLIFRFAVAGHLVEYVAFAALGAASFTAISMLCGSRTSNSSTMNGMTNLISLPMMILSGIWFSRSSFPDWMESAARLLPLTALVDGLRRIALEGASLATLGPEIAILTAYLVICTIAAKVAFKWY